MVWVPLRTDRLAPLHASCRRLPTMSLEWLTAWSWSLDGLRDCIAAAIQSVRDCDATALATVACLLVLFVWYCYHVGREQPRAYGTVNALIQSADANGLQNGYVYCHSPECVRCTPSDGLNQKLYHNLQEYAKRYSWAGMGRIHKGIRDQGRYLSSRPSIQKPEVFFLPDLPTMPYFSREAQKHDVELLERNFQTILCEFETLYKAFSNCSLPQGWKMNSTPSGEWFTFYLVNQGLCVPRNCRKCPRTYRLLGSLRTCIGNNVFGNACISVLSPGTVIAEHYGPTNIRIRCHLGLKTPSGCELVVGGEPQCWAEGRCLLFDDSFLHTAFHEGERRAACAFSIPWQRAPGSCSWAQSSRGRLRPSMQRRGITAPSSTAVPSTVVLGAQRCSKTRVARTVQFSSGSWCRQQPPRCLCAPALGGRSHLPSCRRPYGSLRHAN
ncbi:PREDICTED: aspartate beta-hydroxylase domain-containing protein 2 [Gavialis gangeticus]|uniref:aspartate beta-hydroxylase domain-containing protein 2 n=1 Tax=Gavialis gangeticus TaxID=94835 RepID=UPI00092E4A8B|nr:PREDICTED: aspartate beta-hydroxylase domain-containing protein 2 [Gavialis gangeticus]